MGIQNIFLAIFIATGFSAWGIIGRFSGATGPWIGLSIIVSTAIPVVIFSCDKLSGSMPNAKAMTCLIVAGIINGIAFQVNSNKMADENIPSGTFLVVVYISMVVIAPLLDWIFNKSIPTSNQWLGFTLAICAVTLLSK